MSDSPLSPRIMHFSIILLSVTVALVACHPSSGSRSTRKRDAASYLGSLAGTTGVSATFDYVVVGAGTGGLAIANRLAADGTTTVAVIEAGTLYEVADPIASAPAGDTIGIGSKEVVPTVDWGFWTEPQVGAADRVMSYVQCTHWHIKSFRLNPWLDMRVESV